MRSILSFLALLGAVLAPSGPAFASACFGLVRAPAAPYASLVRKAHFEPGELSSGEVGLSFIGHATFRVTTPEGVIAVTDYAGRKGRGPAPDIATMNNAHETHFTNSPDPRIAHILRGWSDGREPAAHDLTVGDMRVRNVTTDLLYFDRRIENQNSIFVFEVGDLCIGHLGHLHHMPTDAQFAEIGYLDVVMAPVDGVFTMSQEDMIATLKRLRAQVVIPMHFWGPATLDPFLAGMADEFDVRVVDDFRFKTSKITLPTRPTVVALRPVFSHDDD